MQKTIALTLAVLMTAAILFGCAKDNAQLSTEDSRLPPVYGDEIQPTDYSVKENWIHIPETDFEVDVFYLYPTSWTKTENDPYYCRIDNESLRQTAPFNYLR